MSILIGLIIPVPFWLIHQKYPKLNADKVVTPILCCKPVLVYSVITLELTWDLRDVGIPQRWYQYFSIHHVPSGCVLAVLPPPLSSPLVQEVQLLDVGCSRRRYAGHGLCLHIRRRWRFREGNLHARMGFGELIWMTRVEE